MIEAAWTAEEAAEQQETDWAVQEFGAAGAVGAPSEHAAAGVAGGGLRGRRLPQSGLPLLRQRCGQ